MKPFALLVWLNILFFLSSLSGRTLTRTFHFSSEELTTVATTGGTTLTIPDGVFPIAPGAPCLPLKGENIPLPANAVATGIKVLNVQFETLPGLFSIPPLQPPALLSSKEPVRMVEKDPAIYCGDTPYPEQLCAITGQGKQRETTFVSITISPLQFLPQNRLRLVKKIEIAIEYQAQPAFDGKREETGPLEFLIVTASGLDTAFAELARWRQETGLYSAIRLIDWIVANYPGRDDAEKLRNYLKICARDSGLQWLVLGGDVHLIPVRRAFAMTCSANLHPREDSLPCDLYYSALDGDWDAEGDGVFGEVDDEVDLYPDIYVGRVPVNTPAEARAFVEKLLNYERGNHQHQDHLTRALFSAGILWNDPYTDEGIAKDLIESRYLPAHYTVDKVYESRMPVTVDTVLQLLSRGSGIFNHCGHGWIDAIALSQGACLRNPDIARLTNFGKTGIGYSIGCWTTAFDFDAIAEHFVRHPGGGCVAFLGHSSYGWGSPGNPGFGYSDRFDARFFQELFHSRTPRIGEILARTKMSFIPHSNEANVYRWHQFCLNLLGDPAMVAHTDTLKTLLVHKPDPLSPGTGTARIVVLDRGQPVRNALVALSQNALAVPERHYRTLIARSITDHTGTALLHYQNLAPEPALLTITAPNCYPFQETIPVSAGFNLSLSAVKIVSTVNQETTDFIAPGSEFSLLLLLRNNGAQPTPPLSFSISSNSPLLTITRDQETLPPLMPEEERNARMFSITSSAAARNGETALLTITVQDAGRPVMTFPLVLLVGQPLLRITGHITTVSPPDTVNLFIKVTNHGWAGAKSPTGSLFRPHPPGPGNIPPVIINPALIFPDIPAQDSAWCLTPARLTGTGRLRVGVNLASGGKIFSDTLTIAGASTGIYANFDDGIEDWTTGGVNGSWQLVSRRHHSPPNSFYAGGEEGTYPDNCLSWLISPEFLIPPRAGLTLYRWFSVPIYGVDGLYVILCLGDREDTLDFIGSGGALGQGTIGITADWGKEIYDLAHYPAGEPARLKFVFVSDGDARTGEGFYIDDILITSTDTPFFPAAETTRIIRAFPSPFTSRTTLFYSLAQPDMVEIAVYDINGRKVRTLTAGTSPAGYHTLEWNGCDDRNKPLPPGIYFVFMKNPARPVLPRSMITDRMFTVEKNSIKLVKAK